MAAMGAADDARQSPIPMEEHQPRIAMIRGVSLFAAAYRASATVAFHQWNVGCRCSISVNKLIRLPVGRPTTRASSQKGEIKHKAASGSGYLPTAPIPGRGTAAGSAAFC